MPFLCYRISIGAISAIALMSGALLNAPCALAQPAVVLSQTPDDNKPNPEVADEELQGLQKQALLCQQLISLKVRAASLRQIVDQAKAALPEDYADAYIELRVSPDELPTQNPVLNPNAGGQPTETPSGFSFDLDSVALGKVLQSAATLAGYDFFVLPDHLLITRSEQLTETERSQARVWKLMLAALERPDARMASDTKRELTEAERIQGSRLLQQVAQLIATSFQNKGVGTTLRFGDLNPKLRKMVQGSVDFYNDLSGDSSVRVPLDAPLVFDRVLDRSNHFTLKLKGREYGWSSDPDYSDKNGGQVFSLKPIPIPAQ